MPYQKKQTTDRKKMHGTAHKYAIKFMPPLLLLTTLLTGCTPEEKTMLLPLADAAESDMEIEAASKDFTVKKIYTYNYDTLEQLDKSAFLSGCDQNEIHILSLSQEANSMLEYRQVDYRYGFYDVIGDFQESWQVRNIPNKGELAQDLYIDQLLPSPDGKQLLIYIRSASGDHINVWLSTLGQQSSLLLYDGTGDVSDFFRGSFSPSGKWVTYDATGVSTKETRLVPLYDCTRAMSQSESTKDLQNEIQTAREDYWHAGNSSFLVPDQVLYTPDLEHTNEKLKCWIWDTGLYDSGDTPGLFSLIKEADSDALYVREDQFLPGESIVPDLSLLKGQTPPSDIIFHTEQYLLGYEGLPYPIYQYSADGSIIHYLSNPLMLWTIDMVELSEAPKVMDFPNYVWDFLVLPSGDILVALIKEFRNDYINGPEQYIQENSFPAALQEYWNILSADLYLYPAGSAEGHLLYKNLQNLIGMEYDESNRRILLETCEGQDRERRCCILLEL